MVTPNSKRLIFMGSDIIGLPTLEYLWEERDCLSLQAIYTQPDRARGRGKKVQPNAIKTWAVERGISVYQPEKFEEPSVQELRDLNPDIILVMAYGHILPQVVLDLPSSGIYNIHTSLLPALRGASPIETAVASGFDESGVSLMQLVMKMDAGPIADQVVVPIAKGETGGSYREKLATASPGLLGDNLDALLDGTLGLVDQVQEEVSYCRLLVKQDGQLDFEQPASILAHRINGLFPWPGCSAELEGVLYKFGLAAFENSDVAFHPGEVLKADAEGIQIGTGEGILSIHKLQKPGGKMLPADVFLLGNPISVGQRFTSREMHPLISNKPVSHKRVFQLYTKP